MSAVLVFAGGMVGATLRYLTDLMIRSNYRGRFPLATLCVNGMGSLLVGVFAGAGVGSAGPLFALLTIGFCGALTTYSTFGYDTIQLVEGRAYRAATVNVALNLLVGLGAVFLGYGAASMIGG